MEEPEITEVQDNEATKPSRTLVVSKVLLLAAVVILIIVLLVSFIQLQKGYPVSQKAKYIQISQKDDPLRVVSIRVARDEKGIDINFSALRDEEIDELRGTEATLTCSGMHQNSDQQTVSADTRQLLKFDLDEKTRKNRPDEHVSCELDFDKVQGSDSKRIQKALQKFSLE